MNKNSINKITSIGSSILVSIGGIGETIELSKYNDSNIIESENIVWAIINNPSDHTHPEYYNDDPISEIASAITSPIGINRNNNQFKVFIEGIEEPFL